MAVRRSKQVRPITARTAARRARRVQAVELGEVAKRKLDKAAPETKAQAQVFDRKVRRYTIAGLCGKCAAQAAWGHACGFQNINDPCAACQSTVNTFETAGPRGSKWRKTLSRLEYMTEEELAKVFA
jgi:hypothetical protein